VKAAVNMRDTGNRAATAILIAATAGVLAWTLFVGLPRYYGGGAPLAPAGSPAAPLETASRKIQAHLFYVTEDGRRLTRVEQEVPFADSPVEQARAIVHAQLMPVSEPLVSAIPPGTTLRALFLAGSEAYVDLSPEFTAAHPGGSMNELLTIYTLVEVLTVNLPAITSVQLLVDGRELDTLAGHVNLRQPLVKNLDWVE
jgi:spore germination protein GerM